MSVSGWVGARARRPPRWVPTKSMGPELRSHGTVTDLTPSQKTCVSANPSCDSKWHSKPGPCITAEKRIGIGNEAMSAAFALVSGSPHSEGGGRLTGLGGSGA